MSLREERILELLRRVQNHASEDAFIESMVYGNLKLSDPELQRSTVERILRKTR